MSRGSGRSAGITPCWSAGRWASTTCRRTAHDDLRFAKTGGQSLGRVDAGSFVFKRQGDGKQNAFTPISADNVAPQLCLSVLPTATGPAPSSMTVPRRRSFFGPPPEDGPFATAPNPHHRAGGVTGIGMDGLKVDRPAQGGKCMSVTKRNQQA